jgi:N-acetyltransferase
VSLAPLALTGSIVRLEPVTMEHLDALCAVGLDPELWRLTASRVSTREEMRAHIAGGLARQAAGTALLFANVLRSENRVVGSTGYGNIDPANRRVEIGWTWVARAWQRTAVNTEAKYLMMRHAFEVLGCVRVEFKTDALNAASRAAILRLGAKEEGILRSHMIVQGGRVRDSVYYSVIAGEWPDVKRKLERKLERGSETVTQ